MQFLFVHYYFTYNFYWLCGLMTRVMILGSTIDSLKRLLKFPKTSDSVCTIRGFIQPIMIKS